MQVRPVCFHFSTAAKLVLIHDIMTEITIHTEVRYQTYPALSVISGLPGTRKAASCLCRVAPVNTASLESEWSAGKISGAPSQQQRNMDRSRGTPVIPL